MKRRFFVQALATTGLVTGCSNFGQFGAVNSNAQPDVAANPPAPAPSPASPLPDTASPTPVPPTPQASEVEPGVFFTENGVAIRGADPVAYFIAGRPVIGSEQYAHQWMGVNWHFSSAQNRDLFISTPERYAPQFGGFCAWAVANNYSAPIDPAAWKIVDNRLYLNYNVPVQLLWELDIAGNIQKGNANWSRVMDSIRG